MKKPIRILPAAVHSLWCRSGTAWFLLSVWWRGREATLCPQGRSTLAAPGLFPALPLLPTAVKLAEDPVKPKTYSPTNVRLTKKNPTPPQNFTVNQSGMKFFSILVWFLVFCFWKSFVFLN